MSLGTHLSNFRNAPWAVLVEDVEELDLTGTPFRLSRVQNGAGSINLLLSDRGSVVVIEEDDGERPKILAFTPSYAGPVALYVYDDSEEDVRIRRLTGDEYDKLSTDSKKQATKLGYRPLQVTPSGSNKAQMGVLTGNTD